MLPIFTKYYPRSCRVKAWTEGRRAAWVTCANGEHDLETHKRAVDVLCESMCWAGRYLIGDIPGGYVFVQICGDDLDRHHDANIVQGIMER